MKTRLIAAIPLLLLAGSVPAVATMPTVAPVPAVPTETVVEEAVSERKDIVLPIAGYGDRRTLKRFGTWVDDGRFLGYHLGEDVEYEKETEEVPVFAIADGTVLAATWARGYGGLIVVRHEVDGRHLDALYGHLDHTAFAVEPGERVAKGDEVGRLGDDRSHETDDRRKHLHFALRETGEALKVNGYTLDEAELDAWIDPEAFFRLHGVLE